MAAPNHTLLDASFIERLEEFHAAYDDLQLLSGLAQADSSHVSSVLLVLNQAFRDFLDASSRRFYPSGGIRLVKDD